MRTATPMMLVPRKGPTFVSNLWKSNGKMRGMPHLANLLSQFVGRVLGRKVRKPMRVISVQQHRRSSLWGPLTIALMLTLVHWQGNSVQAAEECLSCHGPGTGLTNSQGRIISLSPEALRASVHKDFGCLDCHAGAAKFPHTAKTAAASCQTCHAEAFQALASGAHAKLGKAVSSKTCIACHGDHGVVKPSSRGVQLCASCHETEVKQFRASVHGRARGHGNGDAPNCAGCHGPTHSTVAAGDPQSPVTK